MKKILVTGSNGQLGSEIIALSKNFPDFNFIFTDRSSLDLTNFSTITSYFEINKIDFCINCAAYTAVDKAESEYDLAMAVNADAVENLALACKAAGAILIHISSDYVFDGKKSSPYTEVDTENPVSSYGNSKLIGEKKALTANSEIIIIRTQWVYSSFGVNFVKRMIELAQERDELKIVFDQIGTPTYARELAKVILKIITDNNFQNKWGIYNFSNEGVTSWYDFALAIIELKELKCKITPIRSHEYITAATRPAYSVLDKSKIKHTFSLTIPHWRQSLAECLKKL